MNTVDIIIKKRDGRELSEDEIRYIVDGYTSGAIPDYQMSAFLMAVYFRGMNDEETICLTKTMRDSGEVMDLSGIAGIKVDKHSTGGVGDKTTLIVGPAAAACGVPVAKMSGRGLGFTGGTIDKLGAIPGFHVAMAYEDFVKQVNSTGIAVTGQTGHIAPADKKIYALRDVTGTVDNLSLITSSIMSKKLAAGSDAILLDVKCGSGAFMKTEQDARRLAELMVKIGSAAGKETVAVITDMDQPLGRAVGNALEVREAIQVLKNEGPDDITELSVKLAGTMVCLGGRASSLQEGEQKAAQALSDGSALQKFREFVAAQGGDPDITEDPGLLPSAEISEDLKAWCDGYIAGMDTMRIGLASQHTGAGRETKDDEIDLSAGLYLHRKTGEYVRKGDVICTVYGNDVKKVGKALEEVGNSVKIRNDKPEPQKLIKAVITV